MYSTYFFKGGMAAFILQLFHKLEKKTALGDWNIPCKFLRHKVEQSKNVEVRVNQRAVEENQGQNYQHNVQVNDDNYDMNIRILIVTLAKSCKAKPGSDWAQAQSIRIRM